MDALACDEQDDGEALVGEDMEGAQRGCAFEAIMALTVIRGIHRSSSASASRIYHFVPGDAISLFWCPRTCVSSLRLGTGLIEVFRASLILSLVR